MIGVSSCVSSLIQEEKEVLALLLSSLIFVFFFFFFTVFLSFNAAAINLSIWIYRARSIAIGATHILEISAGLDICEGT